MEGDELFTPFTKSKPTLRNAHDALFFLLHAIMEHHGFKLVGLGEEGNRLEEKVVPEEWNANLDSYSFRYRHFQSSLTYLLKAIRLGDTLIVYASTMEQKSPASIELSVDSFVSRDAEFPRSEPPYENLYRDVSALKERFTTTVVHRLMPPAGVAPAPAPTPAGSAEPRSPPPPDYGFAPRRPDYVPPDYDDDYDYDPLRIGPPRRPQGRWPRPGFGVGDDDLNPHFAPPPGGGNRIGPHHPGFGPLVGDPYAGRAPPRGPGNPRFDPYGPPAVPRPFPDNDHLPPPGGPGFGGSDWGDMFG